MWDARRAGNKSPLLDLFLQPLQIDLLRIVRMLHDHLVCLMGIAVFDRLIDLVMLVQSIFYTAGHFQGMLGQPLDIELVVHKQINHFFQALGKSAVYIGSSGSGSTAKLVNQIIVNNTIAVVSEALVFAAKAGADPEKVFEAIRGGLAGSAVLDAKAPMMIEHNFKPGGPIRINHKDIKNVMETAHSMDVPVPYTAQLYEILQALKIHGCMNDDHAGIVQYFEKLADIEVNGSYENK